MSCDNIPLLALEADVTNAISSATPFATTLKEINLKPQTTPEGCTVVAEALKRSPSVVTLRSYCRLTDSTCKLICEALKNSKHIKTVSMMQMTMLTADGWKSFADVVEYNTSIESLYLGTNTGADCYKHFSDALAKNTTLTHISVTPQDNHAAEWIGKGLKQNRSLKSLFYSFNNADDVDIITESMTHCPNIKSLNMDLGNLDSKDVGCGLAKVLSNNSQLLDITLDNPSFSSEGVKLFASAIGSHTSLEKLAMDSPKINEEDFKLLINGFNINKTLQVIYFTGVNVSTAAWKEFFDAMKLSKSLKKIVLMACKLTDSEARYIGGMLSLNSSIETINLTRNTIQDLGMKLICSGLAKNSSLKRLRINFNNFHGESCLSLQEALHINESLVALELLGNSIGSTGCSLLIDIFKKNRSILNLKFNPSDDTVRTKAEEKIKHNLQYQKELAINLIIIMMNLARDNQTVELLPAEIWIMIFSYIRIPFVSDDWSVIWQKILADKKRLKWITKKPTDDDNDFTLAHVN